jgi:hypothetical protein
MGLGNVRTESNGLFYNVKDTEEYAEEQDRMGNTRDSNKEEKMDRDKATKQINERRETLRCLSILMCHAQIAI